MECRVLGGGPVVGHLEHVDGDDLAPGSRLQETAERRLSRWFDVTRGEDP